MSYHLIPADTNTQLDLFEDQGAQPLVAHIWRREERVMLTRSGVPSACMKTSHSLGLRGTRFAA